ncbi:hypothetical protein BDZ97DRAFT_72157 [Flammula alnicola]|nr:hypothetical protein BDZ97DRAFT_72157 [Flammula alnicola]
MPLYSQPWLDVRRASLSLWVFAMFVAQHAQCWIALYLYFVSFSSFSISIRFGYLTLYFIFIEFAIIYASWHSCDFPEQPISNGVIECGILLPSEFYMIFLNLSNDDAHSSSILNTPSTSSVHAHEPESDPKGGDIDDLGARRRLKLISVSLHGAYRKDKIRNPPRPKCLR